MTAKGMGRQRSDEIQEILRTIRNPENSYCGITRGPPSLPDNLLVFVRSDGSLGLKGQLRPINQHHRFVLVTALEGSGAAFVNGCHFVITPGHGMLVFPHQLHYFLYDDRHILWVMVTFELEKPDAYRRLRDRVFLLPPPARDLLYRIGTRFSDLQQQRIQRDHRLALMTGLFLDEVADTADVDLARKTRVDNARAIDLVERINGFINANLERHPGMDELARAFSYSPSRLRQLYRQTTGITIGAYIEHMRMRRAQAYLVTGGLNVSETAGKCGYESLYSFSRAFKRYNGCSPTAYRSDPRYRTPPA